MDIIGAINHNFQLAGLRAQNKIIRTPQGDMVEVGYTIPTRPKPTIIRARVPVDDFDIVGDEVGAKGKKGKAPPKPGAPKPAAKKKLKPRQKIKKALKKATGKALKTLTKVAAPLANVMAPGSGTALKAGVALLGKATSLKKKAKKGDKKAAKLMNAPLKVKPTPGKAITPPKAQPKAAKQAKGRPAPAAPIRATAPKPRPVPSAAPTEETEVMDAEEAIDDITSPEVDASDFGEFGEGEDLSVDDAPPGDFEEFGEGDGGELDAADFGDAGEGDAGEGLESVEGLDSVAGIYTVKTPKGKVVRVKLP